MYMAKVSSRYNSSLTAARHANLDGVYDIHTNVMQYPRIMQPTHARWEQVPSMMETSITDSRAIRAHAHTDSMDIDGESVIQKIAMFPPVDAVISRNYMITDTYYEGPPKPDMPYPGPDGDIYDIGPPGLCSIADDIIAELPADCKKPFIEARDVERQWKLRWGTEHEDGARAYLPISYNSY